MYCIIWGRAAWALLYHANTNLVSWYTIHVEAHGRIVQNTHGESPRLFVYLYIHEYTEIFFGTKRRCVCPLFAKSA